MDIIRFVKNLAFFSDSNSQSQPKRTSLAQYEPLMGRLAELEDIKVTNIMVPRSILEGVDIDLLPERIQHFLEDAPSHILVYRGDLNSVVGWVSRDELAQHVHEGQPLEELCHDIGKVSENLSLKDLFLRFVALSHPLLLVMDDKGQVTGVVYLQALLDVFFGLRLKASDTALELQ